jgi:predicted dehydrogenase
MARETLTTAVLGLDDSGRHMLEAAASTGLFQIKAVADLDQHKAQKAAAQYGCEAYADYRQLIVQNQFDCLLVAADIHTCDEQLRVAMKKKFHLLKLAPPARNFEECLEYVRMAESEKVQFAVGNPGRYRSAWTTVHELLARGAIEQVFLIAARYSIGAAEQRPWRNDPKLAGGGVLLHECYPIVDHILRSFPVPEQVYALTTNQAPDKQQRLYLTEDTAVVCMKFGDTLTASLVATRRHQIGPDRLSVEIHGRGTRLTLMDNRVTLDTPEGQEGQQWQYDEGQRLAMERLLSSFALSLLAPGEHTHASSAAENLRNMAVLESAYLSARTGFPEEPARILRLAGGPAPAGTSI